MSGVRRVVVLREGVPTADGRLIEEGAVEWRREIPLLDHSGNIGGDGHEGAELLGKIGFTQREADGSITVMIPRLVGETGVWTPDVHAAEFDEVDGLQIARGPARLAAVVVHRGRNCRDCRWAWDEPESQEWGD